ncbi:MAG: aromatic ring-hydroxylating dioxygenase subunit alpha, partial [Acidimicrobiia bacterium]|nr:aromatic ring-hydroxylating dioxygenase subunit alpha [Acidimicrobiia bacterium]
MAVPVPYAMEHADRVPKERYFDRGFYDLECELLWPRVWQMACRLEEVPEPGDFVEYEILDQSLIVLRVDATDVRAFQNTCRHRGVKLVEGRGTVTSGFTCPFHGWCYGVDGANTFVSQKRTFAEHNLRAGDIDLVPVRCETWAGCAWINLDADAPPLRQCIEPAATTLDAWNVEGLGTEWWYAARLPVNWKLAVEAFIE